VSSADQDLADRTAKDAPRYVTGLVVCSIMMAISILITFVWWAYLVIENRRRDREAAASGLSEKERAHQNALNGELDLTDKQVS